MKTLINSVLKSSLVATIFVASLCSLNASAATLTADKDPLYSAATGDNDALRMDIKKVVVTGNVTVLIAQSNTESVKVDDLDLDKVSLKQVGGTLTVSSSESTPVTIVVYVKDIYRIDASGKSTVRTLGKFTMKNLQIMLKDEATARVKANTESLYTVIDGHAKLELIGTSDSHVSKMAGLAKMDTDKFAALKTENVNVLAASASSNQTLNLSK